MNTELITKLTEILSPVILMLVGLLAARASQWINAQVKSTYLRSALLHVNEAVEDAVKELEQTVVPLIREAAADGSISPAEAAKIKREALSTVMRYLGNKGITNIAKVIDKDALEVMIRSKVEAKILDMKVDTDLQPIPVSVVPPSAA